MTRFFFFLILFVFCSSVFAVGNVPDDIKSTHEAEARLRYLHVIKNYTLMGEVQISDQSDNRKFKSALIGSYYRFSDNLRTGFFYQRQYGLRHDNDWFKDPVTLWQWRDTNNRGEDLAILDISPKFILPFADDHWTFEFKTRYEYNFFNSDRSLRLRPNLTYFWLHDSTPLASFFLQAEQTLALNYGTHSINERWLYLGALYHHSTSLQVGAFIAQKWQEWSSTPEYTAITGKTYTVEADSQVFGATIILKN